ncbi:MAG: ATP-binding protein [Campylobacterota bacterium]|nr:ATP-binding protein [Campylobacterota bacterium]
MKQFIKLFKDSIIGPVVVVSISLSIGLFYLIPFLSQYYAKEQSLIQSERLVTHIRMFRAYYNDYVLSKVRAQTDFRINYDHRDHTDTLPLPATTVHDLGKLFTEGTDLGVRMYSNFPFPNREDRILDGFQERSLSYLLKHPDKIYTEYDENKRAYRSAFPDFLTAPGCVSCHNTRADTPRRDWKLGDIRGAIEVISPVDAVIGSSREMTLYIIAFVGLNLFILIVHYSVLSFHRSRRLQNKNATLEEQVGIRTGELERQNKILSEYKQAVDDGAIVSKTDTKGKITYINDAFEVVSGYSKDELIGKNHNTVRHPESADEIFSDLWSTIKAKKVWSGEIQNLAKDGSSYFVHATISPILDENDNIIEYLAIRYETTQFHEAIAAAQKAERAKGQFLANMSHELRTPLNAIIGFSQILQHRKTIPETEITYIDKILISGQNLLKLVNTILDFSKIEEGKMEYHPSEFFLGTLIREVHVLVESQIQEKSIAFTLPDLENEQAIFADIQLLKQVLINLLSNAIKFTPQEGTITLSYKKENEMHYFSVCDSGSGIAKEELDSLFTPFIQGKEAVNAAVKGTGLGLAISKRIVEDIHKGHISVTSELDKGSCFSFDFPSNLEEFTNHSSQ